MVRSLQLFSPFIYKDRFGTLFSLQLLVHHLFNAGFSDNIGQGIFIIFGRELFVFCRRDLAGITYDWSKIYAVGIFAYIVLFDIHALQLRLIFIDIRHGLFAYIGCDRRRNIPLEIVLCQCIAQD